MSAWNPWGLPRYVEDDPAWLWFMDPENFRPVLAEFDISENDYVHAWNEVLDVFPLEWARHAIGVEHLKFGSVGIHPHSFGWLRFHPVAKFLAQKPYGGWHLAAPVLRLGLDLLRTRKIPGGRSIRRDLRNLEQYTGRLFELEALSEFRRRGLDPQIVGTPDFSISAGASRVYLEARHRGVPFWRAVVDQVRLPVREDWPCIRVDIKFISGIRTDASRIASEINQDIDALTKSGLENFEPVVKSEYVICCLSEGKRCTMVFFGKGPDLPWSQELEKLVFQTLVDKSNQILSVAKNGHPSALVMDCRSLLPPQMPDKSDPRNERREEIKTSILRAGTRFLHQHGWVSGVVWWWRLGNSEFSLREAVHGPWLISMSTRDGHVESFDPTDLRSQPPP